MQGAGARDHAQKLHNTVRIHTICTILVQYLKVVYSRSYRGSAACGPQPRTAASDSRVVVIMRAVQPSSDATSDHGSDAKGSAADIQEYQAAVAMAPAAAGTAEPVERKTEQPSTAVSNTVPTAAARPSNEPAPAGAKADGQGDHAADAAVLTTIRTLSVGEVTETEPFIAEERSLSEVVGRGPKKPSGYECCGSHPEGMRTRYHDDTCGRCTDLCDNCCDDPCGRFFLILVSLVHNLQEYTLCIILGGIVAYIFVSGSIVLTAVGISKLMAMTDLHGTWLGLLTAVACLMLWLIFAGCVLLRIDKPSDYIIVLMKLGVFGCFFVAVASCILGAVIVHPLDELTLLEQAGKHM